MVHALPSRATRPLLILAALGLADALTVLPLPPALNAAAALCVVGLLPGALTWLLLRDADESPVSPEGALLALGLALGYVLVGGLLLHYLPGPLRRLLIFLPYNILVLALLAVALRTGRLAGALWRLMPDPRSLRPALLPLALIVLLAAVLRGVHLGYAEFQGDEVAVLHRAAAAIVGADDALFLHKKGPGEILLAMLPYAASRRTGEFSARLPYAALSVMAVLGVYALGRRALDERAGLWAALLLALNGFFVAFGRIVQYQTLVLVFSVLCLLAALRYRARGRTADVWLCALFGALGLWCHTDAAYVLPAAGLLVAARLAHAPRTARPHPRRFPPPPLHRPDGPANTTSLTVADGEGGWGGEAWAPVLGAAAWGLTVLALFYVPYVRHPFFATTRAYLATRWGSAPPYSHWWPLLNLGSVYNASYYLLLMAVGLVLWALYRLRGLAQPPMLAPVMALGLLAHTWLVPGAWQAGGRTYVGAAYLLVAAALLAVRGQTAGQRAVLLWFAVPFLLYLFWVEDPRTHFYILFPGAALLLGEGLALAVARLPVVRWPLPRTCAPCGPHPRRWSADLSPAVNAGEGCTRLWVRGEGYRAAQQPVSILLGVLCTWGLLMTVGAVLAVSTYYLYVAFVSHTPEYRRNYPATRLPLFWVPYGDQMPTKGLFGFPYRAGWQAVAHLYAQGVLQGDYGSNEEAHITGWYLRDAPRCDCNPRYYLVAENVQDAQPLPAETLARDYALVGLVRVDGRPTLRLYERQPAHLAYAEYDGRGYQGAQTREGSAPRYPIGLIPDDPLRDAPQPLACRLGEAIELVGYRLETRQARPGQALVVTLYWRAHAPIAESLTAFVHVEDPGVVWAGKDCAPGCGTAPTTTWEDGRVYRDGYALMLVDQTPSGEHALVAGMYDPRTGRRLAVSGCPASLGDAVSLGTVAVAP
ncbi:MAG: glycosyltransferase family 39 protein [Chloroflexota bacterium]